MSIDMDPIGVVATEADDIPFHWSRSEVTGRLLIQEQYLDGLRDIEPGQRIQVIFCFHQSPKFSPKWLRIRPPMHDRELGVFSTGSPFRPNPIGLSQLEVTGRDGAVLHVKGLDMVNETPVLDIKPVFCPVSEHSPE